MGPTRILKRSGCQLLFQVKQPSKTCRRCLASIAPEKGKGPLAGIRILDMTRVLAGVGCFEPCCLTSRSLPIKAILHSDARRLRVSILRLGCKQKARIGGVRMLARWLTTCSAEVIKVEHPTRGDDTRAWGPPFAKYKQGNDARHVGPPFAKNVKENPKGNLKGPGESAYFIAVR
jgi:hypothetical protein